MKTAGVKQIRIRLIEFCSRLTFRMIRNLTPAFPEGKRSSIRTFPSLRRPGIGSAN